MKVTFLTSILQYGSGHVSKGQGTGNFVITMEDVTEYEHVCLHTHTTCMFVYCILLSCSLYITADWNTTTSRKIRGGWNTTTR